MRNYLSLKTGSMVTSPGEYYIGDVANIEGVAFLEQGPIQDFTVAQSENFITRFVYGCIGLIALGSLLYNLEELFSVGNILNEDYLHSYDD